MVVQRKWMYLESIFIGGDIRAQLPEEAKKFDGIDKTFKKVGCLHSLVQVHVYYYNLHRLWWRPQRTHLSWMLVMLTTGLQIWR